MTSLRIVPANEATFDDLQDVFGERDYAAACQCTRFLLPGREWWYMPSAERREVQRERAHCEQPDAATTTGLVAFDGDEAVGWCAVGPRVEYVRLLRSRIPWPGRDEDKSDETVWALTCFVTRKGHRGHGLTYELARAAVAYARQQGAGSLEGYPMVTKPGEEITWGEMHVGNSRVFDEAGFAVVSRPSHRRAVMRIDF